MALRIRFQYPTGNALGYSIERLADGFLWDFSTSTFAATPVTLTAALPEDSGSFLGRYKTNLSPTPSGQFSDGDYCVTLHNVAVSNAVVGMLSAQMHGGDDATVFASFGSGADPLAAPLPGSYAAGTAGARLAALVLAPNGLDGIPVEGMNLRQAMSPILAAACGVTSGAPGGPIVVKGGNVATTRISASVDTAGNRTSVTLALPT
jgi:hypothetical protein